MVNRAVDRLRRNHAGFWRRYGWLAGLFLVGVLADTASTIYFMVTSPKAGDIHPGIEYSARLLGPIAGPLLGGFGKAIAGLGVAVYLGRWGIYVLVVGAVLGFWAAWYNIWGVNTGYYPNLLRLAFW